MSTVYLLALNICIAMWSMSRGSFLTPNAYTLPQVMAVNGSNANGVCPTECVVQSPGIRLCDCTDSTLADEAITASVLIDGVVPTIDTSERNSADEFVWAAPLLTVRTSTGSVTLGFRFQTRVVLCEVELYVFHCPAWGIGADNITIHNGATFPQFIPGIFPSRGRVFLTSDMQDCTSLTRVSIPLQMATSTSSYFIEINSVSGTIEWVHIAEVRFSDQCDSTTMAPTDPTTTSEYPEATSQQPTTLLPVTTSSSPHTSDLMITTSTPTTSSSTTRPQPQTQFYLHTTFQPQTLATSSTQPSTQIHTDATSFSSSTTSTKAHTLPHPGTPSTTNPSTSSPATSALSNSIILILVVVIVFLVLLMAAGCVLFIAVMCVLRARSSVREVKQDADRIYDTIEEREVINKAYGHIGEAKGGTDRVYDTIQEKLFERVPEKNEGYVHFMGRGGAVGSGDGAGVEMVGNSSYGHVGVGGGVRMTMSDASAEMVGEVEYEELKM